MCGTSTGGAPPRRSTSTSTHCAGSSASRPATVGASRPSAGWAIDSRNERMRRRILVTLISLVTIAVAALFVPAAVATRSRHLAAQEVELQRDAAIAASSLPIHDTPSGVREAGDEHRYALYDSRGARVAGDGPPDAEPEILAAVDGDQPVTTVGRDLVVGLLIRTADPEGPFVLRASEPRAEAEAAIRHSILGLGAIAL